MTPNFAGDNPEQTEDEDSMHETPFNTGGKYTMKLKDAESDEKSVKLDKPS